ncbi:ATP-dependent DEAD/DEAH box RNA helicase, putative [Bodo saltans]|uniref:RNA helicase n=1 Tax=Bodo saltans TaxID=75058 RepID=A0A0S4IQ76_BODSA|nr:ATP-dependent DEAD/DEAH box RNA helicase, putative [Bodo saltans]|eukprot:CUF93675.1 ATP-dependent DEAD/DEAH box RNA helicase, putative [Bodo saltans]
MWDKREAIQRHIAQHQVTLLVGETGSGKTTQLPQFVFEMKPKGRIACTQPRRVAAMSVGMRVAEEMDVRCGSEVGFSVRFHHNCCESTKIVYMTDGMLLREAQGDPLLSQYSVIVIDEAHERAVDTDILLGIVKLLCAKRSDLRVVVMSATLDMQKFQEYFTGAPLLRVPGRMFNVAVFYTQQPVQDYVAAAIDHAVHIHLTEPAGDILVFLIGEAEIERAITRCQDRLEREMNSPTARPDLLRFKVLPLYGSLSLEAQKRVFMSAGPNTRKIIFSTNIAETSVTIDGVVFVVDSGYHKQTLYDAKVRIDSLLPAVISKASAEQRKGRAGRTRPGKCFRMFCEKDYPTLPDQSYPEVLRTNMLSTVLIMYRLGLENPCQFPFLDPPSHQSFLDAFTQLIYYGALDENDACLTEFGKSMADFPVEPHVARMLFLFWILPLIKVSLMRLRSYYGALDENDACLTDFGKSMADFPVEPHVARMLIKASGMGCSADVAVIAAMIESGNVFLRPGRRQGEADQMRLRFENPDSDHITLFNVFHAFLANHRSPTWCDNNFLKFQTLQQAERVYMQLVSILQRKEYRVVSAYRQDTKVVDSAKVRRAMLEGLFTQVAFLPSGFDKYRMVREKQVAFTHTSSVLNKGKPQWVMYDRLELQGKEGCFIRVGSVVDPAWLPDVHEEYFDPAEIPDGLVAAELRAVILKRNQEKAQSAKDQI